MSQLRRRYLCLMALFTLNQGCASLNSVSLTQIPETRNHAVEASVDKFIFLGFNFDNDYADQLLPKLKEQCPDGQIKGILTKHESISYFIFFKKIISAKGFCVK